MNSGQRKVLGTNNSYNAFLPVESQTSYSCANSAITRGLTGAPFTLDDCFTRFPKIQDIVFAMGVTSSYSSGVTTYNFWQGPHSGGLSGSSFDANSTTKITDPNLADASNECEEIKGILGEDWLGCLWGSSEASYSCTCPYINDNFEAYLKHRLTVATFWNTSKYVPIKRREFMDELMYGPTLEITVPGDFSLTLGRVVQIDVSAASGYPYIDNASDINGKYWIIQIKHIVNSGGTHESRLRLMRFAVTSPS